MSHPLRDHIETVSKLSDSEFDYILSHFVVKKFKKHAPLIREGEIAKYEYFVLKGCLRSYKTDIVKDKEFTYNFAAENWWISDQEAFLERSTSTITIDCLEECELLGITLEDQEKLGANLWKYEHYLSVKANLGNVALQKRLHLMIMGTPKERYENFVHQYPYLLSRVPKYFIASSLGVSRETISRLYRSNVRNVTN